MKDSTITALVAISGFVVTLAVYSWRDDGSSGIRPDSGERQQPSGSPAHIPSLTDPLTTIPFAGSAKNVSAVQSPEAPPQPIRTARIPVPAAPVDEPAQIVGDAPNTSDVPAEPPSPEERQLRHDSRRH
jgi:hypothetical protein